MSLNVLPSDQLHLYTNEIIDMYKGFYHLTSDKTLAVKLVNATIDSAKLDALASIAKSLEDFIDSPYINLSVDN